MPRARKTPAPKRTGGKLIQPPAPVISFRISPHGVSGYPTTGVAGAYSSAHATSGITSGNLNPASSRYDIQAGGNTLTIRSQGHTYNQTTPVRLPSTDTISAFTSEPVWESTLAGVGVTTGSLARNQILQATPGQHVTSQLRERARVGFLDNDLYMQTQIRTIDRGVRPNQPAGDVVSPVQPVRLQFTPFSGTRQGEQNTGTMNNVGAIPSVGPTGQNTLHDINDVHTPQPVTAGYSAPGTHPAHGPSPSPQVDGSWTLDVLPGGQGQIGLMNLPPAADIPVQTYSGAGPRNTSIHYTRPSGGKLITHTQAVAPVPVFA